MEPSSLELLVQTFVSTLQTIRNGLFKVHPVTISEGISRYNDLVRTSAFKNMAVKDKSHIYSKLSYLNNIYKLRAYSWNGGDY